MKPGTRGLPDDRNRVEPGDAIGIGIRIPRARIEIVAGLLAPALSRVWILGQPGTITLYATVGRDSLNGRPASHRWVNVITDPPSGVPADAGIGGLACIGSPTSAVNRMWWRHGLGRVPGRLAVEFDRRRMAARVRIDTAGGRMVVDSAFSPDGAPWAAVPQQYYVLSPDRTRLFLGDEWGIRHDGAGSLSWSSVDGVASFDTYVGLDVDLGWDYRLGS